MQQTETYKLNKPETTDPFTPVPLNENADKLEAALLAETAARQALDGRVQVLELHRMAVGRFTGATTTVELDFVPKMVIAVDNSYVGFAIPGDSVHYSGYPLVYLNGNTICCGQKMSNPFYLALA